MKYQILQGDNRDTLKTLADNSIDAIVTDPPYGIDFLGKSWDANTGALETYQECLRVLKPGGHILAFSAARTYHHLAVTLEQAGFEIRDQIMWIYSSGFPKSQDIGKSIDRAAGKKNNLKRHDSPKKDNNGLDVGSGVKCPKCNKDSAARYNCQEDECGMIYKAQTPEAEQWLGWGTALKPAHEPIALARKPLHKNNSIAKNCQQWGTGALNIDATRIPTDELKPGKMGPVENHQDIENNINRGIIKDQDKEWFPNEQGRFPSNVIGEILQDDYQKYFYCPKVSRKERHIGFDTTDIPTNPDGMWDDGVQFQEKKQLLAPIEHYQQGDVKNHPLWDPSIGTNVQRLKKKVQEHNEALGIKNLGNNHPTVKPIELMKYLIKLITPPGGIVLDPFNGSGSTGCAAVELGFEYIGCELDPAYVEITNKRIAAWNKQDTNFEALFSAA